METETFLDGLAHWPYAGRGRDTKKKSTNVKSEALVVALADILPNWQTQDANQRLHDVKAKVVIDALCNMVVSVVVWLENRSVAPDTNEQCLK